jgi:hypothetical protein
LCTVAGFYRATPSRRACWNALPPRMFVVLVSTTSPTPPAWISTRSALCSWPLASHPPANTRWCRRWRPTGCARPKRGVPTSRRSASSARSSRPDRAPQGRQDRDHPARAAHGQGDRPRDRRPCCGRDLPRPGWSAGRPPRRLADRPSPRPQGWRQQAGRASYPPPRRGSCFGSVHLARA